MCSSDDLKELSLPLGPRKKLIQFISEYGKKKELQEVRLGLWGREKRCGNNVLEHRSWSELGSEKSICTTVIHHVYRQDTDTVQPRGCMHFLRKRNKTNYNALE